jgi:hypothetical protein
MTERPIIFSGEMVRAILEGRKTQTRRVVKHIEDNSPVITDPRIFNKPCPYGQPGDRLWVREAFQLDDSDPTFVYFRADGKQCNWWRPSIHMPRWASRITLEITGVRVERLQEINRGGAMQEGCPFQNIANVTCPLTWFSFLWNSIYRTRGQGWDANPWVWVIEFRRIRAESELNRRQKGGTTDAQSSSTNWYVLTRRRCVRCGVEFIGPLKGREMDNYCQHPCRPDKTLTSKGKGDTTDANLP